MVKWTMQGWMKRVGLGQEISPETLVRCLVKVGTDWPLVGASEMKRSPEIIVGGGGRSHR